MRDSDLDDLDRLFLHAPAPAPPADIGARARARLAAIRSARRLMLAAALDLVALAALAALAFALGAAIVSGEAGAALRLAFEDWSLALDLRADLARSVLRGVPWPLVLATALDALALTGITLYILRKTDVVIAGAAP